MSKSNTHNIVVNDFTDEGTLLLRKLVLNLGGARQAAHLMEVEFEELAGWTRKGLPKKLWPKVKKLVERNAPEPHIGQNSRYIEGQGLLVSRR